jgi:hypothetical protein
VILCSGDTFWIEKAWLASQEAARQELPGPLADTLKNQEREIIEMALAESKGKVAGPRRCGSETRNSPLDAGLENQAAEDQRNVGLSLMSSKSFFLIPENPALAEVSSSYNSV